MSINNEVNQANLLHSWHNMPKFGLNIAS